MDTKQKNKRLVIGTHNGIFHSDEVVAIAIFHLAYPEIEDIQVIRSRDTNVLKTCDFLVDIGGGTYDHHQPGGNGERENGIAYASAGLAWDDFGFTIIHSLCGEKLKNTFRYDYVWHRIDDELISKVDLEDNGDPKADKNHPLNFIPTFMPVWSEEQDFDKAFSEVLQVTIKILEAKIKKIISEPTSKKEISARLCSTEHRIHDILEIPCQNIDWKDVIVKYNASAKISDIVNFVIFPYPDGGWAAQCVPPSMEDEFNQRIPFPKEWAGQTENLPKISGVADATFCHNGCFFARASSKEGVVALCKLATTAKSSLKNV